MNYGLTMAFDWSISALESLANALEAQRSETYNDTADEIRDITTKVRKIRRRFA